MSNIDHYYYASSDTNPRINWTWSGQPIRVYPANNQVNFQLSFRQVVCSDPNCGMCAGLGDDKWLTESDGVDFV